MTEKELFERMHAQIAPMPKGFHERHDALMAKMTMEGHVSKRRSAGRFAILALAAVLLVGCGAAVAADRLGLAAFWSARPEAQKLIESEFAQEGGVTPGAVFTVREAVFDGRVLQTVTQVQGLDGFIPVTEESSMQSALEEAADPERRMVVLGSDLREINGVGSHSGSYEGRYEEDGTLVIYQCSELDAPIEGDIAHVTMDCWYRLDDDNDKAGGAKLTFDIPCVTAQKVASDAQADMEQLTITHIEAAYTSLGMYVILAYTPGDRIRKASLDFVVYDGDQAMDWMDTMRREETEDGFVVSMQFPCPQSMPKSLTIGVKGLNCRAIYDFEAGTVTVEEIAKGEDAE